MIFLRGNTASQEVPLGYFVDSTDGNTEETALTIANTDIKIWKAGATTLANKNSGGATHISNGVYYAVLDATDTNTYGPLKIFVHVSGALACALECAVLPEIIYDSYFPASAGAPLPIFQIMDWGTAQTSAAGTLVHRSGLSLGDDVINGAVEYVYSGTGSGQRRIAHDFVGATDTSSISPNWGTTPSTDSLYATFVAPPVPTDTSAMPNVNVASISGDSTAADNLEAAADGTGYNLGGGSIVAASVTGNVGGTVNGLTSTAQGNVRTAVGLASANIDTQLSGIQSDTNDIQTRIPTALVSGRIDASVGAMAANVMTAAAAAADLTTELQSGLATAAALSTVAGYIDTEVAAILAIATKLDGMLELDGSVYRYTINALEQAPAGGGGGSTDWTADERTAIRAILGIPGSGTTPADPSSGILDTIRDSVVTVKAKTDNLTFTVSGQVDANMQSINDVTIVGNGQSGNEFDVS